MDVLRREAPHLAEQVEAGLISRIDATRTWKSDLQREQERRRAVKEAIGNERRMITDAVYDISSLVAHEDNLRRFVENYDPAQVRFPVTGRRLDDAIAALALLRSMWTGRP
jgi:uncharacterized sporulation protein YeaH/YhbH (DUF444 family)